MPTSIRPGDVLADRYRLVDLLSESGGGRFWRAHDRVLERHVALHVISADDSRADSLLAAARRSATVLDPHILRVLDAERAGGLCYVVNEWGSGTSLDIMLAAGGVLAPRRAAWVVAEVAAACSVAHAAGVAHGRLNPENVLVDTSGAVRIIGWCVDAALHGRPEGRPSDDVADLAGLLYAGLTGKWAGPSASAVHPAPTDHGRVLRPRQVRAGIPRPLDALCDEVLNPQPGREHAGVRDAQDLREALEEFVGDPAGLQESMVSRLVTRGHETVVLPSVPDFGVREDSPSDSPSGVTDGATDEVTDEATDEASAPAAPPAAPVLDVPTEAALPAFGDTDEQQGPRDASPTRAVPAPPPPPLEDPPVRPLFAPDPADGGPVRRPRTRPAGPPPSQDYWPWETTGHAAVEPPGGWSTGGWTTGGWSTGAVPPVDGAESEVPGRRTLRLAVAVLVSLLLLVAVAVAFNLGRGRTPLGTVPEEGSSSSATPSPSATPEPLTGVSANDFDPQGDAPFDENPELAPAAVDGDPATAWRTLTYLQEFGPGGLKSGVGLVLDLGAARDVAAVQLQLVGEPTTVQVFVTEEPPTGVQGLEPAAEAELGTEGTVELDQPVAGSYVTVWLTSLPAVPDGFRGEVAEATVLAAPEQG